MVLHDAPKASDSPGFQAREVPRSRHAMVASRTLPASANAAAVAWGAPLIGGRASAQGPLPPRIVAHATHGKGCTQARDPMRPLLRSDKAIAHGDSRAEYAAAFSKMSRSSVTRASSRLRRVRSVADSACRPEPGNAPPCPATCSAIYEPIAGDAKLTGYLSRRALPRISSCTASRLNVGVTRRRCPMSHLLGGYRASLRCLSNQGQLKSVSAMSADTILFIRTLAIHRLALMLVSYQ
jgi:hypothetical protein